MKESSHLSKNRLVSIDALRGLVMLIMLLDHVRETVYLHMQVSDPVDVKTTAPLLIFFRFLSSFCAPTFVFLAWMGAYFYSQKHTKVATSQFLLKRGIFLILLEVSVIGFAWTGVLPPEKIYLQIIWCIGICMIVLGGLIHLPRGIQIALSLIIIGGHNLLDGIQLHSDHPYHTLWAILHQKDWIEVFGIPARTTYPVLPWVGIILSGFILGHSYAQTKRSSCRQNVLLKLSGASFGVFILLRGVNLYGDQPWHKHDQFAQTVAEFFGCLTKYPPSLLFTTLTLSFTLCALALFERFSHKWWVQRLSTFGTGAMFFYVLHLYVLKALYLVLVRVFGTNQGAYYGVDHVYQVGVWTLVLVAPLWGFTLKFVRFKKQHPGQKWLSYF